MLFRKACIPFLVLLFLLVAAAYAEVLMPHVEEIAEEDPAKPTPKMNASPVFDAGQKTMPQPSLPAQVVEESEYARVNWTEGYVEATGQAVVPKGRENTPQGKLLARRGAVVDLQRNLLESIQGVRVDSRTTMTDFMASDVVKTEVQGLIKAVEIKEGSWDGETYTVKGRVKLEKIREAILPALQQQPGKKAVPAHKPKGGGASGLLVDVRHLPLIPALIFRILDENGKEVYGLDFVDQERFLSSGLCDYHTELGYARDAPRIAASPLVIKAVRTVSPENVDMVISNGDAARIRGNSYDFRIPCKVTVVKR